MSKIYLLNNQKFDNVENLEVFGINYISSDINLKNYEALVFTSKNAIYSIDSFNKDWKNIPSYVIAPKTADVVKNLKGNLVFVGISSHGNEFAMELIPLLKGKKVLYIKASKTVSNLSVILKENSVILDELIAYETTCKKVNTNLEKNSVFIFTSPSSVECFFKQYTWNDSYKAIVIGKTTANYLPKEVEFSISSETSVEECVKLARQLVV